MRYKQEWCASSGLYSQTEPSSFLFSPPCCLDGVWGDVMSHLEPYGQRLLSRDERVARSKDSGPWCSHLSRGLLTPGLLQRCGGAGDLLSFLITYHVGSLLLICTHILTSTGRDFYKERIKNCMSDNRAFLQWDDWTALCNPPDDHKNRREARKLETTKGREQFFKRGEAGGSWQQSLGEHGAEPGQVLEQEDPWAFGTGEDD